MVEAIDRQICFRLAAAMPAAPPLGPLHFSDAQAQALSELLQVFACGEESASLAFTHLSDSPLTDATRRGLARIAKEELMHERLLRRLRGALPAPVVNRQLRHAMIRFYHRMTQVDIGLHLASIAALDSAVCSILATLLAPAGVLAQEPTVTTIIRRIHRDEARHVRLSRRLAAELARGDAISAVAENARLGLVEVLVLRGAAFESLGVDAAKLFAGISRVPEGLFR